MTLCNHGEVGQKRQSAEFLMDFLNISNQQLGDKYLFCTAAMLVRWVRSVIRSVDLLVIHAGVSPSYLSAGCTDGRTDFEVN